MNTSRKAIGILLVFCLHFSGCGTGGSKKQPDSSVASSTNEDWKPSLKIEARVAPGGALTSIRNRTSISSDSWRLMGQDYVAVSAIPVTRDEWMGDSVMLEFPPLAVDHEITDLRAQCSLSRQEPPGGDSTTQIRANPDHGRWWISLLSCVGGTPESLDADQWIWVDVEITRRSESPSRARFGFRLIGPVSAVSFSEVNSISDLNRLPVAADDGSIPVFTQNIKNDGHRRVEIEIHLPAEAQLWTTIRKSMLIGGDLDVDPEETDRTLAQFRSRADLLLTGVAVGESHWNLQNPDEGTVPHAVLDSDQWVQVVWYGRFKPSTATCVVAPAVVSATYDPGAGGQEPGPRVPGEGGVRSVKIRELISALELVWNSAPQVIVFPGGLAQDDPDRSRMGLPSTGGDAWAHSAPSFPDYSCQGRF